MSTKTVLSDSMRKELDNFSSYLSVYTDINKLLNAVSLPYRKNPPINFKEVDELLSSGDIFKDGKYHNEKDFFSKVYNTILHVKEGTNTFRACTFKEYYENAIQSISNLWRKGYIGSEFTHENGSYISKTPCFCEHLHLGQRMTNPTGSTPNGTINKFRGLTAKEAFSFRGKNPGTIVVYLNEEVMKDHSILNSPEYEDKDDVNYVIDEGVILIPRPGAPGNYDVYKCDSPLTNAFLEACFVKEEVLKSVEGKRLLPMIRLVTSRTPVVSRDVIDPITQARTAMDPNNMQALIRQTSGDVEEMQKALKTKRALQSAGTEETKDKETPNYNILSGGTAQDNISKGDSDGDKKKEDKESKEDNKEEQQSPFVLESDSMEY